MRVTVIVAAYNAASSIKRALDSALGQTVPDLELIVVDDASTDKTADIVAACMARDPRVRLIRSHNNLGPGGARNLALEAARGDWIAVLDADDRFSSDRLARLLRIGESTQADMVADNLLLCDAGRRGNRPMFPPDSIPADGSLDAIRFVDGNTAWSGSERCGYGYLKPLIRCSFLKKSGLRYDLTRFSEDYLLYLRCLLHGARWMVTPDTTYEYTVTAHSATIRHRAEDLVYLIERERGLLDQARVTADPALAAAMDRHLRSVERALDWFRFAEAVKNRDIVPAVVQLFRGPGSTTHILRQGLVALTRAVARFRQSAHR